MNTGLLHTNIEVGNKAIEMRNADFFEIHEIIDADLKIAACSFSNYDANTKTKLLESLEADMNLSDIEMRWDLDNGYTILNKDNPLYEYAMIILPKIMTLSNQDLEAIAEKFNFKTIKYIIECEQKRRELFRVEKEMQILEHQCIVFDNPVINKVRDKYSKPGTTVLAYSSIYQYGFIEGKRAERARRKAKKLITA